MTSSTIEPGIPTTRQNSGWLTLIQDPEAFFHVILFVLALGVVGMAFVLRVDGTEGVVLPILNERLPGMCTYQRWLGMDCPGCGLTRSFISLAHGDFVGAWRFNPAGILFFAITAAQIPLRIVQLRRIRRGHSAIKLGRVAWAVFWLAFVTLFVQWIARMVID